MKLWKRIKQRLFCKNCEYKDSNSQSFHEWEAKNVDHSRKVKAIYQGINGKAVKIWEARDE